MFEIGSSLREARIRQRLDFNELERGTKIRAKYLRALEEEHFELLPSHTYIKGFLRSYAEYLGLDGQLYVDEYNSRFVTGEEDPPVRARRSTTRRRRDHRVESRVLFVALVSIGILTALVIAAWKFTPEEPQIPNLAQGAPTQPAKAKPKVRPRAAKKPKVASAKPQPARLLVRAARGACWLEVRRGSASGALLYEGTLDPGQVQRFVSRRLWLSVGAPANLDVTVNGKLKHIPTQASPQQLVVTAKRVTPAASGV